MIAAAVFNMGDGTEQLHYFVDETSDYIHSMVFAPILVNWLSPGGLFIGARRLTLTVRPCLGPVGFVFQTRRAEVACAEMEVLFLDKRSEGFKFVFV